MVCIIFIPWPTGTTSIVWNSSRHVTSSDLYYVFSNDFTIMYRSYGFKLVILIIAIHFLLTSSSLTS
ncbi:hypothetical protein GLOIN_2v1542011 [Rhizophagus irregularis DAOM 181602=DAOM 197198]|uniref:Uncharacterized protein n=1 Tax=Rhizophagus irregularis (strain DAOM 181602 / DAOM 197198 / MUCL 43194) TaxID=747089 RepID=A0A2P4QKE1_RHIID|nr:hypothetical protein GLOIN_2v1542011 [Rhizophagus irregularis DAOM 181602=DAOM 197198]POG78104.1 hypothetical protein GLOIN_2v1542011 [Rhizophagus irregularis DAOM 181602=DAOM 197198]|eukprot:XP_025184970.1 hypothetical protein GLOIN_2v1542011 [Rhizophagus irregularis DAOM 181602=DAOM 197198]